MRVHLIHGIHTEGVSPVQGLIPYLQAEGFDVVYPDYGWIAGLETKLVNPIIRGTLLAYIEEGDVFIGHSNGCAIAYDLMNSGAPVIGAMFINGALEQRITRPTHVRFIEVYYNPGDEITEAAKIAEKLGLVDPVWGEMGHAGYLGTDSDIHNHNCGAGDGMPVVAGHSDFFTPIKLQAWGAYSAKDLRQRLTEK